MIRLILLGTFFLLLTDKRSLDAARELYGQPSDRIRPANLNTNQGKSRYNSIPQQPRPPRGREYSPSFVQSRRYHPEQLARDNRDLGQPLSFATPMSSSYYYSYGGPGTNLGISSQEGCRLTNNYCARDHQCCSGKCRCVRWSVMGKTSCYKKCY